MTRLLLLALTLVALLGVRAEVPLLEAALGIDCADAHDTLARDAPGEDLDDDCCPDQDGSALDCCDWDLGACCAGGIAALPLVRDLASPEPARFSAVDLHSPVPLHLLRPRDNGPPPTPPPIA